jgi:Integrase core domain
MGETRHEIFGIRQDGDHPAGRAIDFGGSTHAGETWHSHIVFSTAGMIGASAADQKPPRIAPHGPIGLEPYPRGHPQPDCRPGAGSAGTEPTGTGGALHGRARILCLEDLGLSAAEAHDLVTGLHRHPSGRGVQGQDHAPNQLWQADFTYLKITGWGWYYLSTVLDDFSRFIVAWKFCATMKAKDVTATLGLALAASGLDQMTVVHRPRLLSDNGASYVADAPEPRTNRRTRSK